MYRISRKIAKNKFIKASLTSFRNYNGEVISNLKKMEKPLLKQKYQEI